MGERKQVEGSLFFSAQKEIPLGSHVATAPNVIPEPRPGSSSDVSYQRQWQEPSGQVAICRDNYR